MYNTDEFAILFISEFVQYVQRTKQVTLDFNINICRRSHSSPKFPHKTRITSGHSYDLCKPNISFRTVQFEYSNGVNFIKFSF